MTSLNWGGEGEGETEGTEQASAVATVTSSNTALDTEMDADITLISQVESLSLSASSSSSSSSASITSSSSSSHVLDVTLKTTSLISPLPPLLSACGYPAFTNYVAAYKDCLDYILVDSSALDVVRSAPLPSEEVLQEFVALPSKVFGSDHVSLVADVKFKS